MKRFGHWEDTIRGRDKVRHLTDFRCCNGWPRKWSDFRGKTSCASFLWPNEALAFIALGSDSKGSTDNWTNAQRTVWILKKCLNGQMVDLKLTRPVNLGRDVRIV